ncbi:MAG: hypothetical protein ACLQQ4_03670 [Bacteroidia bacterium]
MYQGQNVYAKDEKWHCTDVTLLPPNYQISYILTNDAGEKKVLDKRGMRNFITEKEHTKNVENAKLQQQEILAKQKEEERIEKENEKKLKDAKDAHKAELITKYGQRNGELISEGKVAIGMTKEMCKEAWGTPWDIYKTTTVTGTDEQWFYSWKYNLYFRNGMLVKIED